MEDSLRRVITYYCFFVSFYLATQLYENRTARKNRSLLCDMGLFAAELGICALCSLPGLTLPDFIPNDYLVYFLICAVVIWFEIWISDAPILRKIYIIVSATITRHIGRCIVNLLNYAVDLRPGGWKPLVFCLIILLSYIPTDLTLGRAIRRDEQYSPPPAQTGAILLIVFFYFLGAYLEPILYAQGKRYVIYFVLMEALVCYALLWVQYMMYRHTREILVVQYENELQKSRLEQYDQIQYLMEQMNIKSHDLKHQIQDLESQGRVSAEAVDDLERTIGQYDAFVQTGNLTLDTILTQKKALCAQEGIQMMCLLDGKTLDFLSAEELRNLFGNALDNAIEYLRGAEMDERYIKIRAERQDHFIRLTFENPCAAEPVYAPGGSLRTTKRDQMAHGYGTKSILRLAEKHGGMARFQVRDRCFYTEIMFPAQE